MNQERLVQNIIDQIKEAQIKLGYIKETVRLYYPAESICDLLVMNETNASKLLEMLQADEKLAGTGLGQLKFAVHDGRIEVSVPPQGAEYVHRNVEDPDFLREMIELFAKHHGCTKTEICEVFEKYSKDYVCRSMPEGMDFDYVLYFRDETIDPYYYCVKEELGHTIYHRFTREDYRRLFE